MRRCLACNACYPISTGSCPSCDFEPVNIGGFECYAPDLAHQGDGFKAGYFADLAELEGENFWFRSRNQLIQWVLDKYFPEPQSILEIGCGTGYVISAISRQFPRAKVYGSEVFVAGLEFAATRSPSAKFMQMDARDIPFLGEFDVIGAFDVLEHIEEDEIVLTQMHEALKPDGIIVLTVPQHAWLWSESDDYACHKRRYSAKELVGKVQQAGFEIVKSTSFVTTLLPAMVVSRILQKRGRNNFDPKAELSINSVLDSLFRQLLGLELAGIRLGLSYPFGGSRLIIASKSQAPED
jgi:2-polyprenyl-3-methyl-5-hydroxy-6-metoxy-1,4-benzoquinol methylase